MTGAGAKQFPDAPEDRMVDEDCTSSRHIVE